MKFRKKPVDIDSIKWNGENAEEIECFLRDGHEFSAAGYVKGRYVDIGTSNGLSVASKGDWIIREGRDNFYPCKPDIFAKTYDPA